MAPLTKEQKDLKMLHDRARVSPADPKIWLYLFEYARNVDLELAKPVVKEVQVNASTQGRAKPSAEWLELYWRSLLFAAPYDLDSYLIFVERNREPVKKFYQPRRKVLLPAVRIIQDLEDDLLDLASISCPPGIGKTTLGLFGMSWVMGKHPEMPNLASAHADKLTRSFYEGVNSIITDPEYRWADVFPIVKYLGTNAKDETINLDKNKRFKSLTCRSIGGGLTGATRCEKLLYCDDLCSGIEEALSIERMNKLYELYTNDLKSRKKEGCKELHIATRWSVHDVIGRLERQYEDDPKAKFYAMPALDENGQSNFDYGYGVGFSTKYFLDMKASLDDVSWRCLFQNEPVEREGLLYHEEELNRYLELPDSEPDAVLALCDTKSKGTDYCFLPIVRKYGDRYYLGPETVCDNAQYDQLYPRLASALIESKAQTCQFESNNGGIQIGDKVGELVKELGGFCHITSRFTTANKETKIIVNAPWVKEHVYFLDSSKYLPNDDYGRMMRMLCSYTIAGKKNRNDDIPDGLAMLSEFVQALGSGGGKAVVLGRRTI